jgi:hypothetical protein
VIARHLKRIVLLAVVFVLSHTPLVLAAEDAAPTPASTTDNASIPVWIAPELGATLATLDQALKHPFDEPFHVTIMKADKTEKQVTINNCDDYNRIASKIYGGLSDNDFQVISYNGVSCLTIKTLQMARPAKRSYVKNFHFNQASAKLLPPQLGLVISPDDEDRVHELSLRHKSLSDYEKISIHEIHDASAKLRGDGWIGYLTVLARGDFIGTGLEELLVRRQAHVTEGGTYGVTELFELGRTTPRGQLELIRVFNCTYQYTESCGSAVKEKGEIQPPSLQESRQ